MGPESNEALRAEEEKERERHDELYAEERLDYNLALHPKAWERFDWTEHDDGLPAYLTSVRWLGDVRGKAVLDMGCGSGWMSVILAKRGAARVYGFDISAEAVDIARERARANGVADACEFVEGSAYEVPFGDGMFDVVAGQAVLHHLRNKEVVASELDRVMASGGVAAFHEPLGNSIAFERFRQMLPFYSETDDPDHWKDKLTLDQLAPFHERFTVRTAVFELLYEFHRYVPALKRPLARLDEALLRLPLLQRYARAIVIGVEKA